jgi:hypothetical protein
MRIRELCQRYDEAHKCYREAASTEASVESSRELQETREQIEEEVRFAMTKIGSWVSNHYSVEVLTYFNTWFITRKGWA